MDRLFTARLGRPFLAPAPSRAGRPRAGRASIGHLETGRWRESTGILWRPFVTVGGLTRTCFLLVSRHRRVRIALLVALATLPLLAGSWLWLRDSSLVSVITMVELTKVYGELASTYYDYIGLGLLVALVYFIMGLPIARLSRRLEAKLAYMKV